MLLATLVGVAGGDLFTAQASQAIEMAPAGSVTGEPQLTALGQNKDLSLRLARITRPTLQLGSTGETVQELQTVLLFLGYYSGPVDGQYLDATEEAVRQFQAAAGLNPDGVVGPATWNQLFPSPPRQANPPSTTTSASTVPETSSVTPVAPAEATNPTAASEASSTAAEPTVAQTTSEDSEEVAEPAGSEKPPESSGQGPVELPVLRSGLAGPAVARLQERLRVLGVYAGVIDGIFGRQTEAAVRQIQRRYQLQVDGIVGPATWQALLAN
ncbi:N-acetylmuramoyl-L-alanine amidase CwlM [Halomicronema hongdechloris C2206]|uniref:N-acetylmuramoyl-L-alanine amidase CwlM n=2 Tax=Halomicronema hongdechloris TaxID=1209493 RepID=A0A1Z3HGE4_9CYAN|nr:N-acetylmuramoyl-L-alanine amidase CwlM [Halomicronema hongdechloris C2206]